MNNAMNNVLETTTERKSNVTYVTDATPYVNDNDVLRCKLTKGCTHGTYCNAFIHVEDQTISLSGLFKGFFGYEGEYVWGKIVQFDSKGKMGLAVCDAPTGESDGGVYRAVTTPEVTEEVEVVQTISLEEQLNQMRLEFEQQIQEANARADEANARAKQAEALVQDQKGIVLGLIENVTGVVSPEAETLVDELLETCSPVEIGQLVAITAANFDPSLIFVSLMKKAQQRGCL